MIRKLSYFTVFCAVLYVSFLFLGASRAMAEEVRVGIGFSIPPYVIKSDNSGLEVEVIRAALKARGHEAIFVYLPNLRLPLALERSEVDCVASNAAYKIEKDVGRKVYASDVTVVFQNYAIALEKKHLDIQSVADLTDKNVLAFNNAAKYLGTEFAAMAEANSRYWELADQSLQVRLLYSERVDVVVSDKRVFHYWRNKLVESSLSDSINLDQPVIFNPIFPSAPRHVAFATSPLRDDFNAGLAEIKANKDFDQVVEKYVGVEK